MSKIALLRNPTIAAVLAIAALAGCYVLYMPGMAGVFYLDDTPNLDVLKDLKNNAGFAAYLKIIFTNGSGMTGRPVSMFSFALQHDSWPDDPAAFKNVNVAVHLLNGALLYGFFYRLTRHMVSAGVSAFPLSASLAAMLWLLHPIQISTVLYVVQRMTELSALFMLLGLHCYLQARARIQSGRMLSAVIWAYAGIGLSVVLAMLSKENGILLLVYIGVLEKTVFLTRPMPGIFGTVWRWLVIYCPLLVVTGYLVSSFVVVDAYQGRHFTLAQRLLTESRVLLDYLFKLFIPQPRAFGFFFDDFTVSENIFSPISTLAAVMTIILLIGSAWYARRKAPVYSFGVFWFFGGHLLESTIIPLELYWEHRNYLPVAGPLFSLCHYGVKFVRTQVTSPTIKTLTLTAYGIYFAFIVAISRHEITLWRNPVLQAAIWGSEKPHSRRAQQEYANFLFATGEHQKAIDIITAFESLPEADGAGYLVWMEYACLDKKVSLPPMDLLRKEFQQRKKLSVSFAFLAQRLVGLKEQNRCITIDNDYLIQFLTYAVDHNRINPIHKSYLHFFIGRLYVLQGLLNPAMEMADLAVKENPSVLMVTYQIEWLTSAQLYDDALEYVQKGRSIIGTNIKLRTLYGDELNKWEKVILHRKALMNQLSSVSDGLSVP
ncbi:MAG: hypothetical protein ACU837_05570 [Gammaproteobacteria bacterium]